MLIFELLNCHGTVVIEDCVTGKEKDDLHPPVGLIKSNIGRKDLQNRSQNRNGVNCSEKNSLLFLNGLCRWRRQKIKDHNEFDKQIGAE